MGGQRWKPLLGIHESRRERSPFVDHGTEGGQGEHTVDDRLAGQPRDTPDRDGPRLGGEVFVEDLAQPVDDLAPEPGPPARIPGPVDELPAGPGPPLHHILRSPRPRLPRPVSEWFVVAQRHPVHRTHSSTFHPWTLFMPPKLSNVAQCSLVVFFLVFLVVFLRLVLFVRGTIRQECSGSARSTRHKIRVSDGRDNGVSRTELVPHCFEPVP